MRWSGPLLFLLLARSGEPAARGGRPCARPPAAERRGTGEQCADQLRARGGESSAHERGCSPWPPLGPSTASTGRHPNAPGRLPWRPRSPPLAHGSPSTPTTTKRGVEHRQQSSAPWYAALRPSGAPHWTQRVIHRLESSPRYSAARFRRQGARQSLRGLPRLAAFPAASPACALPPRSLALDAVEPFVARQ